MVTSSRARRAFIALLFASAASLVIPLPGFLNGFFGFLQAFILPGIVFLAFLGDREQSSFDRMFLVPLYSPVVLVLLVLAANAATGSFHLALKVSVSLLYILLALALFTGRLKPGDERSRVPGEIVFVSLAFCGLIAAAYILNDFLFYHDTCRHSSVANEIIYRGIPPMEPFFADIPIRTMWFQHLFQASWKELSGMSIFHTMWTVNLVSAFAFPYLISRITSLFSSRRAIMIAAPIFAVAGLDAAAWILWPVRLVRAFFGEVSGVSEITRIIGDIELNSRFVVNTLAPDRTFAMNLLDKYLTIDVHHYSMNLLLVAFLLIISREFQKRSAFRAGANLLLIIAGTFLFRIMTGIALISTAILSCAVLLIVSRWRKAAAPPTFQKVLFPLLAALVFAIGMSYYRGMTGGLVDGIFVPDHVSFNITSLITIAAPLAVLVPFSLIALRKIYVSDRWEIMTLGAWAVSLAASSILADVNGTLENYFIFPLFMLLIAPISSEILTRIEDSRGMRRGLLTIWIGLLFIVPPVLTVRGYVLEKPASKHLMRRYRITDDERSIYEWIRDNTEIDAIILERNEYNVMPYYAYRRNFYMTSWEILNFGYAGDKVERYKRVRDDVYIGMSIPLETVELLKAFPADIYAVLWDEDLESIPELEKVFESHTDLFEKVFENAAARVYRVSNYDQDS